MLPITVFRVYIKSALLKGAVQKVQLRRESCPISSALSKRAVQKVQLLSKERSNSSFVQLS
jgi:hypothetical protein